MAREDFCRSLFELTDIWTLSTDADEYRTFLKRLFFRITVSSAERHREHRRAAFRTVSTSFSSGIDERWRMWPPRWSQDCGDDDTRRRSAGSGARR